MRKRPGDPQFPEPWTLRSAQEPSARGGGGSRDRPGPGAPWRPSGCPPRPDARRLPARARLRACSRPPAPASFSDPRTGPRDLRHVPRVRPAPGRGRGPAPAPSGESRGPAAPSESHAHCQAPIEAATYGCHSSRGPSRASRLMRGASAGPQAGDVCVSPCFARPLSPARSEFRGQEHRLWGQTGGQHPWTLCVQQFRWAWPPPGLRPTLGNCLRRCSGPRNPPETRLRACECQGVCACVYLHMCMCACVNVCAYACACVSACARV